MNGSTQVYERNLKNESAIYLDYQATTPLDSQVFEAMRPYFSQDFGNPHASEHAVGWRAARAVDEASGEIGAMIGSDADEIIFTSGATEANNMALLGIGRRAAGGKRNRILLSAVEHKCVLEIGRILQNQFGYSVTHIPVDRSGHINLVFLEDTLGEDVLLVSVMAVNNEIGTRQDIPAISALVSSCGALLHTDAAQGPCALDLTDYAQHVDLMSLSSHKMYGPMGIGALFARRELHGLIEPVIYGGGQQNGLRSGTLPTALCVGFGAAARLSTGRDAEIARVELAGLRDEFLRRLEKLPCQIWINGSGELEARHPGNINVGFTGILAADLLSKVQPCLAASTGSACTSGTPEVSHVLRAIGLNERDAASSIRFSLGRFTTGDEIAKAADILSDAIDGLMKAGLAETA